jgi:hypothetical protein
VELVGAAMPNTSRKKLDYFEIVAVGTILLGATIIAGVFYTYDVSRQAELDDVHAQAHLETF